MIPTFSVLLIVTLALVVAGLVVAWMIIRATR
jgi:hypothetical protein